MKKTMFAGAIVLLLVTLGQAQPREFFGGFWHMGAQVYLNPQAQLNQSLESLGYSGFTGTGYGFTFGGGWLVKNIYMGGWGSWDFNSQVAVNNTAQRTLTGGTGGRGGFEFGYAIVNTPSLHLIPSISLVWGGSGYTFTTNMTFTQYVNNPVDFSPGIDLSHFSLGIGVNLLAGGKNAGFMLKALYLYNLAAQLGPVNFQASPTLNQHNVMISTEVYFGEIAPKKVYLKQINDVEEEQ